MKFKIARLHWILSTQYGLDPLLFIRGLIRTPRYIIDYIKFLYIAKKNDFSVEVLPCLHDRYAEGGDTKSEYFWQDLKVAKWIYSSNPVRHLDIGSRVDGFVAHVASFREIEVADIRIITNSVDNIKFIQMDLMNMENNYFQMFDSISCLHAVEHFGLGRYGDPLTPKGHVLGIRNMVKLLKTNGTLYLSCPIGRPRIEFNANQIFDSSEIINLGIENGLDLIDVSTLTAPNDVNHFHRNDFQPSLFSNSTYTLAIFRFMKTKETIIN